MELRVVTWRGGPRASRPYPAMGGGHILAATALDNVPKEERCGGQHSLTNRQEIGAENGRGDAASEGVFSTDRAGLERAASGL
jgi:hypothetical protein